jgi:chromosome segregation protein
MRLQHLQLQGYKTFATKTEFLFRSGITAIVGPNGSGKSNILDAIRWVLGEQSFTALRGKRTEDMIYSGSQSRSRAGMAEVTLTLDNRDKWLPIEFSEVTVSRRAYRDGQNEYRINNNRVRLRDVSELLSQSGLSRRTYTIVGQGVVDSVLSLRAQERRELFEEAAGIAHYRDRREEALKKLDETKHNLERVHDIITEIKPRLERLKQQAERTHEHQELTVHLEEQLRIWYGYRWGRVAAAFHRAQQIAQQRSAQYEQRLQTLQALTDKVDHNRSEQSRLRSHIGDLHHQSSNLHQQAEQDQRELAVLAERSRQLVLQSEEHRAEILKIDTRIIEQVERIEHAQSELHVAKQALAQHEQEITVKKSALNARMAEREKLVRTLQNTQDQLSVLRTEIAERESRREALAERLHALANQAQENRDELTHLKDELAAPSSQIIKMEVHLAQLRTEQTDTQTAIEELEQRRAILSRRLERERESLRECRESEAEVAARFGLLSQWRQDFAIYDEATRAVLTASDASEKDTTAGILGVIGVLAQMINTAGSSGSVPKINRAVEAALGPYASAVVVDNWRTAMAALQHVRSLNLAGRVIFLALDSPFTARSFAARPESFPMTEAVPLVTLLECDDKIRPLVERLLGNTYLVPNLEAAQSTLNQLPAGFTYITPNGEMVRSNGSLEGGRIAEQTSPLAQEHEWMALNAKRIELGSQREVMENKVAETARTLAALEEEKERATTRLDAVLSRKAATSTLRDRLARQTDRLQQEIEWRQSQITSIEADQARLVQRQDDLSLEISSLIQERAAIVANMEEQSTRIEDIRTEEMREDLASAQMTLAAARQTLQGQQNILDELTNSLNRLEQERQERQGRVRVLEKEVREVTERVAQLNTAQKEINSQVELLVGQIEPAEDLLVDLEEDQKKLESRERIERARLREFEGYVANARLDVQRREDELNQIQNRIEEDLGLVELELGPSISGQTPLPLHPLVSRLPVVKQLPLGVEDEIKRLRAQLRRLGAINPNAPEEHREVLERYTFLEEQSADLVAGSESLHKVITEMDGLIEHAFRQTFEAVAAEFSKNFVALFGGGQAQLQMTDPSDLTQTGVDIIAQPPGKRLQSLASLSGGERALTAVALIVSILKVSPPPFCFLDEVDAMLDEANVGRFRTVLESLTEHTQIVIITHNRGTISVADTVYGISMGADSVSQVYSLRMEGEQVKSVE